MSTSKEYVVNRRCLCCRLPMDTRKELDKAIIRGVPITELSGQYGVSRDAIYRHKNGGHIDAILERGASTGMRNLAKGLLGEMLDRMQELTDRTESLLNQAEGKGQIKTALHAIQQLRNNYEVMGKIMASTGQNESLDPGEVEEFNAWRENKNNLHLDTLPEWDRILVGKVAVERIIEEGCAGENTTQRRTTIHDAYADSFFLKKYGPQRRKVISLIEDIVDNLGPNPAFSPKVDHGDLEGGDHRILTGANKPKSTNGDSFRVDQTDFSLKPYNKPKKPKRERVRRNLPR